MIISISEAKVTSEHWDALEETFRKAVKHVPLDLRETFLLHDQQDTSTWRIVAVWRSEEAYENACRDGVHEFCVEIFRSVGAEPTRRVFDVPARHEQV